MIAKEWQLLDVGNWTLDIEVGNKRMLSIRSKISSSLNRQLNVERPMSNFQCPIERLVNELKSTK